MYLYIYICVGKAPLRFSPPTHSLAHPPLSHKDGEVSRLYALDEEGAGEPICSLYAASYGEVPVSKESTLRKYHQHSATWRPEPVDVPLSKPFRETLRVRVSFLEEWGNRLLMPY